jgi:hypothetical protein
MECRLEPRNPLKDFIVIIKNKNTKNQQSRVERQSGKPLSRSIHTDFIA